MILLNNIQQAVKVKGNKKNNDVPDILGVFLATYMVPPNPTNDNNSVRF